MNIRKITVSAIVGVFVVAASATSASAAIGEYPSSNRQYGWSGSVKQNYFLDCLEGDAALLRAVARVPKGERIDADKLVVATVYKRPGEDKVVNPLREVEVKRQLNRRTVLFNPIDLGPNTYLRRGKAAKRTYVVTSSDNSRVSLVFAKPKCAGSLYSGEPGHKFISKATTCPAGSEHILRMRMWIPKKTNGHLFTVNSFFAALTNDGFVDTRNVAVGKREAEAFLFYGRNDQVDPQYSIGQTGVNDVVYQSGTQRLRFRAVEDCVNAE